MVNDGRKFVEFKAGLKKEKPPNPLVQRPESLCILVPVAGVEPAPCCQDRILSVLIRWAFSSFQLPMRELARHSKPA